jgi:hypothetical protein
MTAPLQKSTGAPLAQIKCATAENPLSKNSAAQRRATAALPLAQQQQAEVFTHWGISAPATNAATQRKEPPNA